MKNLIFLLLFFPTFLFANPSFQNLIKVNKEWKRNPDGVLNIKNSYGLHDDIIISHLILVEKTLRARPVSHLNEKQKSNRLKYLDILNKYHKAGVVPINDYGVGTFPIFIDRKGTHCAVGYLLQQGGFEHIAQKINSTQKFAYIHQINEPELMLWQKESGFTLDELAWIQPGYTMVGIAFPLGKGLKGEVKDIKYSSGKYTMIAGGKFKIEPDTASVLLAGFDGKEWKPLISGSGIINKIEIAGDTITSYGGDITFGNFNKIEILKTNYKNSPPTHKLAGELNGEITDVEIFNGKKYICGKFTGGLAVFADSIFWVALSSAKIRNPASIRTYKGKLYITGKDSGVNYGLVSYNGTTFSVETYLPKQASWLQVYHNKLFVGLKSAKYTDTLLYSWDGSKLSRFDSIKYLHGIEVKNIVTHNNKLMVTGNLGQWAPMRQGNGLGFYNSELSDNSNPVIYVDGDINTGILNDDEKIVIAGNFNNYVYTGGNIGIFKPLLGCGIALEKKVVAPGVKASVLTHNGNFRDTTLCFNQNLKLFSAEQTRKGDYNVKWYLDKTLVSTADTFVLNTSAFYLNAQNSKIITLVVDDKYSNLADSVKRTIKVIASPKADFSVKNTCNLKPIQFTFTGTKPLSPISTSFSWDFAGEASSGLENPSQQFINPGKKPIQLKLSSGNGCYDVISKQIEIKAQAKADFDVTDVCNNTSAIFLNKTIIHSGKANYKWDFGDGKTSDMEGPSHQYQTAKSAETFNVKLRVTIDNACSDSITKKMNVYQIPKPGFYYTISQQKVNFYAYDSFALDYQWVFGDGEKLSGGSKASLIYTQLPNKPFKVCLKILNSKACTSDTCMDIVFSAGVHPLAKEDIKIYPNPGNGKINIDIKEPRGEMHLEIYNQMGQIVNTIELMNPISTLDLSLANGVYLVKVVNGTRIYHQSIIISK